MENNKKKILDEINNLYGDISLSDGELDLIEKVSESDKFTNEAIELMQTQRSKYNDIIPTKENETEDILMIFSDVKNRMSNNKENNSVTKTDYNMDKILEVTNRYFEGNKDANLTDLQIELLRSIAEYDDATNNLVIWLNDAIENDEERNMENYIDEATNAYEDHLSRDEAYKFVQDLKKLNPDADVKLDKKCTSIDISKPINELNLPKNFYLDENNRITNKENTALSVFVSLKVNEINNKKTEEVNNMNKDKERNEQVTNDDNFLDNDLLEELSKSGKIKKTIKKKRSFSFGINDSEKDEEKEEQATNDDNFLDNDLLEELSKSGKIKKISEKKRSFSFGTNKKKKGGKTKSGFFKRIKNRLKNKFILPDDLTEEEINLDNDFNTEELDTNQETNTTIETNTQTNGRPNTATETNTQTNERSNTATETNTQTNGRSNTTTETNTQTNERSNTATETNTQTNERPNPTVSKIESLGSLVEKYQMLGYEVELRKNKAISYYNEHMEEIKNGSKKQLQKYADKLTKVKELETEYSILKHKIDARRKFEAKKMDQLFNEKYEKRDNIMGNHLTNVNDLNQELEHRKMKAENYYEEHKEEIKNGSKKHLQKYSEKLTKVKELQNEYEVANTKYNSLRKEKQESYNMLFR